MQRRLDTESARKGAQAVANVNIPRDLPLAT